MAPPKSGGMTREQLDKFVKGHARVGARVLDRNLNQQPIGLLKAFPVDPNLASEKIDHYERYSNPGVMNQPLDGPGETTKWDFKYSSKDMVNSWDKFTYWIPDSAKSAAAVNRFARDGLKDSQDYFTACRIYKILSELKSKRATANTHAAGTENGESASVWGVDGSADAESGIVKAIKTIVSTTGLDPEQNTFGIAYPSEVLDEFKQLDVIHQVVQQLSEYLKVAWRLNLYAVTPYMDSAGAAVIDIAGTTSSDILDTSALVFVEGEQTLLAGEYRPEDILLNETSRVHAQGYITTFKQCFEALVIPTDGTSNGKSKLIYEVTGVTS